MPPEEEARTWPAIGNALYRCLFVCRVCFRPEQLETQKRQGDMRAASRVLKGICVSALAGLCLVGCSGSSGILPEETTFVQSPFEGYDDAYAAFADVSVQETTLGQLFNSGYDVSTFPNVQSLSYLDLIALFLPHDSITFADLDPALRACLEARLTCKGYQLTPSHVQHERIGSVMLDVLNFKRTEVRTGWQAEAIFVLHDDVVVYKLWSGTRRLSETRQKRNPLGPFQNLGGTFTGAVRSAIN